MNTYLLTLLINRVILNTSLTGIQHDQSFACACRPLANTEQPEGCQPFGRLYDWSKGFNHEQKLVGVERPLHDT